MSDSSVSSTSGPSGVSIPTPHCQGMAEHPLADLERARLSAGGHEANDPLSIHILHGLAYTVGSALGSTPPSKETCLAAFIAPNKAGLTAGARAWSKHSHRSQKEAPESDADIDIERGHKKDSRAEANTSGWWGTPSGSVAVINEKALELFRKVMDGASWQNLHWLPHQVLIYEIRVPDGYGMRWSQDQSEQMEMTDEPKDWIFRGFLEPQMENGHEVGWRH